MNNSKASIAFKQKHGVVMASILNPTNGIRDEMSKKGIKPKNHHKDNIMKLKKIEEKKKIEKVEKENANQNQFKLSKFKNVESSLKKQLTGENEDNIDDPFAAIEEAQKEKKVFLKAGKREEDFNKRKNQLQQKHEENDTTVIRVTQTAKPPVPKKEDAVLLPQKENKNYIHQNAVETIRKKVEKNEKREETLTDINPSFGKVPTYLKERKKMWEIKREMERLEQEKSEIPEGMILLSDEERLDTLKTLNENKKEVSATLSRMPIVCDTLGLRKRKTELEAKLNEIEDAIRIFSRTKVFVQQ